jgi:hypothetical protein
MESRNAIDEITEKHRELEEQVKVLQEMRDSFLQAPRQS